MTAIYDTHYTALLLLMLLGANWTFFVPGRFVLLRAPKYGKTFAWHVLEWFLSGTLVLLSGQWLERYYHGQAHTQGWAFYTVFFCLFLTAAFPGFVWRFLRRKR